MAKKTTEIPMLPEGADPTAPPAMPAKPVPPPVDLELHTGGQSPRQTLSYIRGLLTGHGIIPKNKLGQNFLTDLNMLDLVVRAGEMTKADSILEVGTGTGTLTGLLAASAGAVYTVEIDANFHRMAKGVLGPRPHVGMYLGDILAGKNVLNPEVLAGWDALTARTGCTRRKLIANLPYAVATPIITNLLIAGVPIERMVVMVQWEIAERLRAVPGTKDYNSLSVLVQSVADVETIRKVGPANFHPRPKVDSAIVRVTPNAAKRARVGDVKKFREFLRDLYTLRRKNLRSVLSGWPRGKSDKAEVDAKLVALGIDGNIRAEMLDIETHLRLCEVFG